MVLCPPGYELKLTPMRLLWSDRSHHDAIDRFDTSDLFDQIAQIDAIFIFFEQSLKADAIPILVDR
jgi:hypothetical protein